MMDVEQARLHADAVLHPKVFRGVSTESRELAQDLLNALEEIERLQRQSNNLSQQLNDAVYENEQLEAMNMDLSAQLAEANRERR